MSALSFLRLPDRLYAIADTAGCYREDGRLGYCTSKIRLATNFPGVIGITGKLPAGCLVQNALAECASFDEMIRVAPARFAEVATDDDAVAVGGYSESRGFEVYYARAGRRGQPFAKVRNAFCGQPDVSGLKLRDALVDIDSFARDLLMRQRAVTWGQEEGFPPDTHCVGAWGELATITREKSEVRTIIRWNDQIGQPIRVDSAEARKAA